MGTSPCGVAIRLSAEAHTHSGQPTGHVPSTGSWQPRVLGPTLTSQHSWPEAQHVLPQHVAVPQPLALHGGVPQVPRPQNGPGPMQAVPQPPQFRMSLPVFTHLPAQQARPWLAQSCEQLAPASAMPPVPPLPPVLPASGKQSVSSQHQRPVAVQVHKMLRASEPAGGSMVQRAPSGEQFPLQGPAPPLPPAPPVTIPPAPLAPAVPAVPWPAEPWSSASPHPHASGMASTQQPDNSQLRALNDPTTPTLRACRQLRNGLQICWRGGATPPGSRFTSV
jgi:hypothetical protein